MRVTPRGFAEIAQACLDVAGGAARGRVVFALEGGYNLDGIARSAAAVMRVVGGTAPEGLTAPAPRVDTLVSAYRETLVPFWPALR
jgi:acetoin utilization deacetylase AcuC-like enzyme